jgi:hypothetical protein
MAANMTPEAWMFVGSLLSALRRSPFTETYDILSRAGMRRIGPADAVILSLNAETCIILRHRRLGYLVSFHAYQVAAAGPVVRSWLQANFELVKRSPDTIRFDYRKLIEAVRSRSAMNFLILNAMSTSAREHIINYADFDRSLGGILASVRNKELNVMLHDMAREDDISIVDVDAIAAELGAANHLPDGLHQSGAFQTEVRGDILRILRARGVPGFGEAPTS